MHVNELNMVGIGVHAKTHIKFPEVGIMLITGDNGSGKSTIMEGVSLAFSGNTLRGKPAWLKDDAGLVQLEFEAADDVIVQVNRKKPKSGAVQLQYAQVGIELADYATAVKAQAGLQKFIPVWESWRRTSVFRSSEMGAFTRATDKQRKELIEVMTGAKRFDPGLQAARKDRKEVDKKISRYDRDVAVLTERIAGLKERLLELAKDLDDVVVPDGVDPDALQATALKFGAFVSTAKQDIQRARGRHTDARDATQAAQITADADARALSRLDVDKCPTCDQDVPENLIQKLEQAATATAKLVRVLQVAAQAVKVEVDDEIEELDEELETLEEQERVAKADVRDAKALIQRIAAAVAEKRRRAGSLEKAHTAHDEATTELGEANEELAVLGTERGELVACETVLGLQGVRAHILGGALSGIESMTNAWLMRIASPGHAIRLRPYSEKSGSSDAVTDKISMTIEGCGGGYGYEAASDGEKRRIDVAMLFSLGEFEAAAAGTRPGTLWLDEIMDGLDDNGIDAVSEVLQELSQERLIVVISHRKELCQALNPVTHLHVKDGTVTDLGTSVKKAS